MYPLFVCLLLWHIFECGWYVIGVVDILTSVFFPCCTVFTVLYCLHVKCGILMLLWVIVLRILLSKVSLGVTAVCLLSPSSLTMKVSPWSPFLACSPSIFMYVEPDWQWHHSVDLMGYFSQARCNPPLLRCGGGSPPLFRYVRAVVGWSPWLIAMVEFDRGDLCV